MEMKTENQAVSPHLDWKKWIGLFFLAASLLALRGWQEKGSFSSSPSLYGANAQLARILSAMGRLTHTDLKIIFDGNEYPLAAALPYARQFLRTHYRGEAAEAWIRKYLYRSPSRGEVIYLKYPDGGKKLLRDVFLQELSRPS